MSNDADGNITQDGTWTYTYDGENRLHSMTKPGTTISFLYDWMGRRVAKTVNSTTTTTYLYGHDWSLAAEMDGTGYGIRKKFVWGPDFSDAHGNAGGAGSLLAQLDSGGVKYAIPDSFGNIVGYLDSGGTLDAATEFTAYGRALNTSGATTSYPIGYSGQYTDTETGLVYYGMRYYNPKHGRFINRDPIEEQGGNNLFGFCGNAPTRAWDVLGNVITDQDIAAWRQQDEMNRALAQFQYGSTAMAAYYGESFAGLVSMAQQQHDNDVANAMANQQAAFAAAAAVTQGFSGLLTAQQTLDSGKKVTIVGGDGSSRTFNPGDSLTLDSTGVISAISAPNSIRNAVNESIASGNLLASNTDGMFSDGSIPWVSRGGEAVAAEMGRAPSDFHVNYKVYIFTESEHGNDWHSLSVGFYLGWAGWYDAYRSPSVTYTVIPVGTNDPMPPRTPFSSYVTHGIYTDSAYDIFGQDMKFSGNVAVPGGEMPEETFKSMYGPYNVLYCGQNQQTISNIEVALRITGYYGNKP